MKGFAIGVAATAIALVLLAFLLPSVEYGGDVVGLILLAIVFGVVNGFIKPIVKLFSLPITAMTLGLFSIVIRPPKTVEEVRKNPLGIYVHAFNWSQDVATSTGDAK